MPVRFSSTPIAMTATTTTSTMVTIRATGSGSASCCNSHHATSTTMTSTASHTSSSNMSCSYRMNATAADTASATVPLSSAASFHNTRMRLSHSVTWFFKSLRNAVTAISNSCMRRISLIHFSSFIVLSDMCVATGCVVGTPGR